MLDRRAGWVRCRYCYVQLPAWAKRAQWEHADQAHRDEADPDEDWLPMDNRGGITGVSFDGYGPNCPPAAAQ